MEVRLGKRTKIKAVLKATGADVELTFESLFDAAIAKAALMQFWTHVRGQLPLIDPRPEDLLVTLAAGTKGTVRAGKLLQQLNSATLVRSVGLRGAGAALSRHCSARSWQRYKRELKALPLDSGSGFSALKRVDEALARFEPLRLKTFQTAPSRR